MRPEDFSPGGLLHVQRSLGGNPDASMRPEDFSPGGASDIASRVMPVRPASMRPEDFSPGGNDNMPIPIAILPSFNEAGGFLPRRSPHPGDGCPSRRSGFNEAGGFLPRRRKQDIYRVDQLTSGFNEAGGFLPRRNRRAAVGPLQPDPASMRPEDFSPGGHGARSHYARRARCFNEAGGFLPRRISSS